MVGSRQTNRVLTLYQRMIWCQCTAQPELEALSLPDAKKLARTIAEHGVVHFSNHATEEMQNDNLQAADCVNLIRGGVYEPPDFINGQWRYRIKTQQMCVVITFLSDSRLRVVTAWRNQ